MSYFRLDSLQRSRITYGCIVALGAITTAGITEIEIHGKVISSWIEKVSQSINDSASSFSPQGQEITSQQVFSPFIAVGREVSSVATQAWPYISSAFGVATLLKDNWEIAFKTIKDFFRSLFDSKIFNKIFENIHLKIWNIITFAVAGGEGRNTFISLFGGSKRDSTFLAAKLLLGQTVPEIKNFKVNPNVFHYLFLRWMDKPKEVTQKFDRLSTYIKSLTDKLKGSEVSPRGNDGASGAESDKYTYWLQIPTLKEYLDVEEGMSEKIFNTVWTGEVLLKMKTGTDDFVGATTIAKTIGGVMGSFWPF